MTKEVADMMSKSKCCEKTFRLALEEVLYTIKATRVRTVMELEGLIKFAVTELRKKEIKNDSIVS